MAKGCYTVEGGPAGARAPRRKDTSFRSFICALLAFLAFLVIVFIATMIWSRQGRGKSPDEGEALKQGGRDVEMVEPTKKTNHTKEKIMVVSVPPDLSTKATTTTRRTTLGRIVTTTTTTAQTTKYRKTPRTTTTTPRPTTITTSVGPRIVETAASKSESSTQSSTTQRLTTQTLSTMRTTFIYSVLNSSAQSNENTDNNKSITQGSTTQRSTSQPSTLHSKYTIDLARNPLLNRDETTIPDSTTSASSLGAEISKETVKPAIPQGRITTIFESEIPRTTVSSTTPIYNEYDGDSRSRLRTSPDDYFTTLSTAAVSRDQITSNSTATVTKSAAEEMATSRVGTKTRDPTTVDMDIISTERVIIITRPNPTKTTKVASAGLEAATTDAITEPPTSTVVDYNKKEISSKSTAFDVATTVITNDSTIMKSSTENPLSTTPMKITNSTDAFAIVEAKPGANSTTAIEITTTSSIRTSTTSATTTPNFSTIPTTVSHSVDIIDIQEVTTGPRSTIGINNSTTSGATTTTPVTVSTVVDWSTPNSSSTRQTLITNLRQVSLGNNREKVCVTPSCNAAASRILSLMNHSASPCEDFYGFACGGGANGGWEDSAESGYADILSTRSSGYDYSSEKHLGDFWNFYDSCLEHEREFNYRERVQKVKELVQDLGWFEGSEGNVTSYDITDLFASLILRQSMPLFDIGLDVDRKTTKYIFQLTVPLESSLKMGMQSWPALDSHRKHCLKRQETSGSFLNLDQVYVSYLKCQKNYEGYINSIERVIREIEAFSELYSPGLLKEIKEIRFSIEFQILDQYDKLPSPAVIRSQLVKKEYDVRRVSDLEVQYPFLQWKRLLGALAGHEVGDNVLVQVYLGDYLSQMFKALGEVTHRKLRNALLAIYANDLYHNTVIPKSGDDRERFCLDLSKKLLPDVSSQIFSSSFSQDQLRTYQDVVLNVFDTIKAKFVSSLMDAEWADDKSKASLLKKLNKLYLQSYASPVRNEIEANYKNLNITPNGFQDNLIGLLVNSRRIVYMKERSEISGASIFSYFLDPWDVRPLTTHSSGLIALPIGLLRRTPPDLPGYVYMARIGFHLAKAISVHFDPTGKKIGLVLSENSDIAYNNLVNSNENLMQYTSPRLFGFQNISYHMNGALSNDERISDNAAFRLALDCFNSYGSEQLLPWISSTYSREKIFFIAVAQEFCRKTTLLDFTVDVFESPTLPAPLQVENLMENSAEFAEKFNCPLGSGQNMFEEKYQFPHLTIVEDDYDNMNDLYKN